MGNLVGGASSSRRCGARSWVGVWRFRDDRTAGGLSLAMDWQSVSFPTWWLVVIWVVLFQLLVSWRYSISHDFRMVECLLMVVLEDDDTGWEGWSERCLWLFSLFGALYSLPWSVGAQDIYSYRFDLEFWMEELDRNEREILLGESCMEGTRE